MAEETGLSLALLDIQKMGFVGLRLYPNPCITRCVIKGLPWVKVFRINIEFRILRLSIESQPQNAELGILK